MTLPTNIAVNQADHAQIHNTTNAEVNRIADLVAAAGVGATSLAALDLDTVTTPGNYYQTLSANVTLANHYPITGMAVTMIVAAAGTSRVQILWPLDGTFNTKVIFQRRHNGTSWGAWGSYSSTRWSAAAGRTAYMWDTVNNREQLVYGDTGWRDVLNAGWLINGWTATLLQVQRVGSEVTLMVEGLNAAAMTNVAFLSVPTGFGNADAAGFHRGLLHTTAVPAVTYRTSSSSITGATTATPPLFGTLRWRTLQAWPTTLPGVAFAGIPNA